MIKLSSAGLYITVAGILSTILYFMDMNIKILLWIDSWGSTIGWTIRIGLIVIGLILFAIGMIKDK